MFKSKKGEVAVGANRESTDKQNKAALILGGLVIVVLAAIIFLLNTEKADAPQAKPGASVRVKDATSRNPGDKETIDSLNSQIQSTAASNDDLKIQLRTSNEAIEDLRTLIIASNERNSKDVDLSSVFEEIQWLKGELRKKQAPINITPDSSTQRSVPVGGGGASLGSPQTRGIVGGSQRSGASVEDFKTRVVKVVDLATGIAEGVSDEFDLAVNGSLSEAAEPKVYDTVDFVPPNAFAPATILVGVDASTGEAAQNDPQAATFLITGAARHVVKDGVLQETDLEGCVVNGAAFGDLSTERVHIKLQRMTCPLENGEVAVQDVQGHATELGKAGIRGTIIDRTGDKIARATIAGALEGLGGALGNVGGRGLNLNGGGGLVQEIPNAQELATASIGGGVQSAAGTLTDYYIERARAIEPVVAMPRGIEVELVFLNGFKARPSKVLAE